jgi:hypothetical protein
MKHINSHKRHITSSSFIVTDKQTDHEQALSICDILHAINNLNDETIVALFSSLDYDRISVKHFSLDIKTTRAFVNDTVTLYAYASTADDNTLRVNMTVSKKSSQKEIPIVNGSFVFCMDHSVNPPYSLS